MISRSSSAFSNCSRTRDGDKWFRSYSSSATTQIEGDICIRIYPYRHAYSIPPGGRAGFGRAAGGTSRAGFAPHGIRGAFNISDISWMLASCSESNPDIFENQVAVVVRLETFMCTDPPRRASRLRFLAFTGFQRRSASFTSCSTSPARTHDGTELHRIISTFVCNTTCSSPSATTLTWTSTP